MQMLQNDTMLVVLVSSSVVILFAVSYVVMLFVSNTRIISEQQSKLKEINLREERYRSLFENSVAGMMRYDWSARKVYDANASMLAIFGVQNIPSLETTLRRIPESIINQINAQLIKEQVAPPYEIHLDLDQGKEQWLLFSARNSHGERISHVVIIDISERKRLERTMQASEKMEMISLLTNSVAHDLQNILSPIKLSLHLLQTHLTAIRRKKILTTAHKSANEGLRLIQTILSVGRKITLVKKKVNLFPVIKYCIEMLGSRKKKAVRIIAPKQTGPFYIEGDKYRLIQVFSNLLSNAMDAMPNGGTIIVSMQRQQNIPTTREASYVTVSISDTGIGIQPTDIGRIFEPFYSTKLKSKGTGVGLAFVNKIVKEHGGYITVASTIGKGTTMNVHLPLLI